MCSESFEPVVAHSECFLTDSYVVAKAFIESNTKICACVSARRKL